MILTNEDFNGLLQIQTILQAIIRNAVMSECEEEHERNFDITIKETSAFDLILSKRRKQMPQKYRLIFTEQWFKDHTRLKPNGVYEIRCSIDKIPISGSSKDLDTAIKKFIKALSNSDENAKRNRKEEKPKHILFLVFAEKWFEIVKKPTVKPITYQSFLSVHKAHIAPYFKGKYIDELTAMQIQPLFSKLYKIGHTKAAINVHLLLNQIFKAAIAERLISFNPMDGVTILKHHAKNGKALTYAEEREFLLKLEKSKFKLTYILMLFCGMRRAELSSARIENYFIFVKNGKQRLTEIQTERKIPITPMLARYIEGVSKKEFREAIGYSCDMLSRAFKSLCPSHHLHELRHTFVTRCQECGVPREVVSVWCGHAADDTMTSNVYTHFSDEFMQAEGKKVDYSERLYNSK